jgi:hypothetical protein
MAQAAIEDETLFAHNIQQYALQHSISWDEVASSLHIGREQLAKLALCSRSQTTLQNGGVNQIANYVGVDHTLLKAFGVGVEESSEALPAKRVSDKLKNGSQWRESGRRWHLMGMLPKHRGWAVGMVVVLILLLGAFVFNQAESASGATLVVNEGQVRIVENARDISQGVIVPADGAFAVRTGDQIIISADSSAQLLLIDGSSIELSAGTIINVDELVVDDSTYRVHLRLLAGRTLSRVVTVLGLGDRFEISTPSSSASVRGTIFTVAYI